MFFFLGFDLEMTIDSVLIEAEGPQLCAGTDAGGQRWLVFRSRSDAAESIWLCSPITERALREVLTGRASPRDAFRHSCTGLVEVVSYAQGHVAPERCMPGVEIPAWLLPPAHLRVPAVVESTEAPAADRPSAPLVGSHHCPATLPADARARRSDESEGPRPVLGTAA